MPRKTKERQHAEHEVSTSIFRLSVCLVPACRSSYNTLSMLIITTQSPKGQKQQANQFRKMQRHCYASRCLRLLFLFPQKGLNGWNWWRCQPFGCMRVISYTSDKNRSNCFYWERTTRKILTDRIRILRILTDRIRILRISRAIRLLWDLAILGDNPVSMRLSLWDILWQLLPLILVANVTLKKSGGEETNRETKDEGKKEKGRDRKKRANKQTNKKKQRKRPRIANCTYITRT